MNGKYKHLFEPLKVNQMILKNRIISAPLGSLTDKSITGIAMITRGTSGSVPDGRSRMIEGPYCFANMELSNRVREQVVTIRQRGAKAEFELCHVGQYAKVKPDDYAIGPVSFTREDGTQVKAMDETMMEEVAQAFAKGALDAKEYGFDMVLLHFGHGWLPTQFLSPHYNKRMDDYGGSLENRMKFPLQIVKTVRQAVGKAYPLNMRISLNEYIENGTPTEEIIQFLKAAEPWIDMVHVSCGLERELAAMCKMSSTQYEVHKINTMYAKRVKDALHIPVAVVGAIMSPEEAEDILARGEADAVVIGRQLIADPFWSDKAWLDHSEDIVPCIRCMNCYNMYSKEKNTQYGMKDIATCAVNPRYLHEDNVPVKLPKADEKKLVYIIGGGPAGCKAALTAYERGHHVVLLEKENHLGGQLECSEYDASKQDLRRYKEYLIKQLAKTTVEVRLKCDATLCKEELAQADSIIVAVGATPVLPTIPGVNLPHVMTAIEAYQNQTLIQQHVTIIGGGSIGSELAKLLASQQKDVTLIEQADGLCKNLNAYTRIGLLEQIKQYQNIKVYCNSSCKEINAAKVVVQTKDDEIEFEAETVILAVGMTARKDLANSFYGIVQDTMIIGDANRPATIAEATQDGYYACATL